MTARTRHATRVLTVLALTVACGALLFAAGQKPILSGKETAPQRVAILVRGHVRTPGGAPMPGMTLRLLSSPDPSVIDMITSTNAAGSFSFAVRRSLVGTTVRLMPSHPLNPSGSFSPAERVFTVTESPGQPDFSYTGPLPDLSCPQANIFFEPEGGSRHYYIQVTVANGFTNGKGLAAGPFKVRATYEDRTVDPWATREIVFAVPGLEAGLTHVEKHVSIGVYPPKAYFRLVKIEVDVPNAVGEANEGNNTRTF